jgi:serine/threonine protein kinase
VSQPTTCEADGVEALVGQVADEFTQRLNRGERPDVEEYARRHPQIAAALREVLPALELMRLPAPDDPPQGPAAEVSGLLGDFRLLRVLGRGGMGVVYEAEQLSLGRRVALKVLPFAGVLDPRQLQRFRNEAQAAACLHHTNIVPVYVVGCERGVHYYAMQLIDGQSLGEAIAALAGSPGGPDAAGAPTRPSALSATGRTAASRGYVRAVARLGLQAAEALEYAHSLGVVHRDVKPANLLLDEAGQLWVTDFGLALCRSAPRLTMTGDVVGTLRYMSPEQLLGTGWPGDPRGDVYSLGVTLYEALALRPAFAGQDREELLRQVAWGEPRPPRRLNPAVPAELETVVLKAMARDPAERYQSARELADDLRRFLEERPVLARPPSLWQRAAKLARRHRQAVAAAALAAVLAVAGLAAGTVLLWHEKEQKRKAWEAEAAQADEAREQRRRAEANFDKALSGATSLLLRLEDPRWNDVPGMHEVREDLVRQGVAFFRQFLDENSSDPAIRFQTARTHARIASLHCAHHQVEESFAAMRRAIALLEGLTAERPREVAYRKQFAVTCHLMGLMYRSLKKPPEARAAFARALEQLRLALPHDGTGDIANNLAWWLAVGPAAEIRDPARAVALAKGAVARAPAEGNYWNTLGAAHYQAGDLGAAAAALARSMELRAGGDAYDWVFLAMIAWRQGERARARDWYAKVARYVKEHQPQDEPLGRLQEEAAALLGLPPPPQPAPLKKPDPPAHR